MIHTFQFHSDVQTFLKATVWTPFPLRSVNDTHLVLEANVLLAILHRALEET